MKRLRHPVRAAREPFGKAGLIVAVVALVAALTGGAYAASGGGSGSHDPVATASKKKHKKHTKSNAALTGKQKKEVEKLAKRYAGKQGAEGKQGPAGAAGPAGAPGAAGEKGERGENGQPGGAGAAGKSVTISESAPACFEGGITVTLEGSGSSQEICNGEEGPPGAQGPQGPAGPTETVLPPGKTETGIWSYDAGEPYAVVTATFGLHLEAAPTYHWMPPHAAPTTECPGNVGTPEAAPGNVCVYAGAVGGVTNTTPTTNEVNPSKTSGIGFYFEVESEPEEVFGYGTWAVTAPTS